MTERKITSNPALAAPYGQELAFTQSHGEYAIPASEVMKSNAPYEIIDGAIHLKGATITAGINDIPAIPSTPEQALHTQMAALTTALVARMFERAHKFNTEVLKFQAPIPPKCIPIERLAACTDAFEEEDREFREAVEAGDLLEASDALIDGIYFRLGRLVEMGVPPGPVFEEVQRANMAKQAGDLAKRPGWNGHDAVKPEGWTPPDHSWLLTLNVTKDTAVHRALEILSREKEELAIANKALQEQLTEITANYEELRKRNISLERDNRGFTLENNRLRVLAGDRLDTIEKLEDAIEEYKRENSLLELEADKYKEQLGALNTNGPDSQMSPIWLKLQRLRQTKGQDYNNVPGGRGAYFPFGHQSYAHMVNTKTLRMLSVIQATAEGKPLNYESLGDTIEDLVNYATYYAEWIAAGCPKPTSL